MVLVNWYLDSFLIRKRCEGTENELTVYSKVICFVPYPRNSDVIERTLNALDLQKLCHRI